MKTHISRIISFIVFLFANSLVSAQVFEDQMIFPGETINNKPLEDYANQWWQWTYTMPAEKSPVVDNTGEHCHVGQSGDIWFLAGGYGSSKISRTCTIPQNKYLFFPIINMVYFPSRPEGISCDQAKELAALNNDQLLDIEIQLNGQYASNPTHARLASIDCFDLLGLIPKKYKAPEVYPAATDGYWMMLKPLAVGVHELSFKAQYNRKEGAYGEVLQDIKYRLIVE